jgi:dihydrofolate reductase
MKISAIVAADLNGVIGKDNKLPWHLPADLKYFKSLTTGHTIIMGRKCYESIGKPLPNRTNIIITRQEDYKADGCIVVNSLEDAILAAYKQAEQEVFIIGGGEIYNLAMPITQTVFYTKVFTKIENGEVHFNELSPDEWTLEKEEQHQADEKNPFDYSFCLYERIS